MRRARVLYIAGIVAIAIAGYLITIRTSLNAQRQRASVQVGANDIGEVVTDDSGRFLIPDLPKAKYTVWARGYGLVDSPKVQCEPGMSVDLKPGVAPDAKTAAEYYPGNYWYALLKVPEKSEFPGTGSNGISPGVKSQAQWIHLIKTDSCESCHQLGNKYTRTIPSMFSNLDPAQP